MPGRCGHRTKRSPTATHQTDRDGADRSLRLAVLAEASDEPTCSSSALHAATILKGGEADGYQHLVPDLDAARRGLAGRADRDGLSATSLLEQLIVESLAARDHPGIVHRGAPNDRRAALAAGPDVWEIIARLQELTGDEESRIATLSDETGVHPRLRRAAVDYAASEPADIERRIERQREATLLSQNQAETRARLLA